jgi:aspartate/methionine/tyrosine aminotransferase
MFMHSLAKALNDTFSGTILDSLISKQGQRLYFPRGIVAQAQEATEAASRYNATAGIAKERTEPMIFPSLHSDIRDFTAKESVDYAPTGGDPVLRRLWQEDMVRKNPLLAGVTCSVPIVTAGITHGLALAADFFADEGDLVIVPEPSWENYELIFKEKRGARLSTYPFFNSGNQFNISAVEEILTAPGTPQKTVLIFNFPHNPTGYSLQRTEAGELCSLLARSAGLGKKLLVIIDDAYFGLFFQENLFSESLFTRLCALHENIAAIKLDGATKEDYAWGLRIGFLTFGSKGLPASASAAFNEKMLALVRTSVSSASRLSQSLLIRLLQSKTYDNEKREAYEKLEQRFHKVKKILEKEKSMSLISLPFNSGYFLTFKTQGIDAQALRSYLLKEKGIGIVAIGADLLRVTWASVDEDELETLFREIRDAAELFGKEKEISPQRSQRKRERNHR